MKQFLQLKIDNLKPSDNSFTFFFYPRLIQKKKENSNLFSRILKNHSREVSRPILAIHQTKTNTALNGIRFDRLLNFRNARNIPTGKGLKRGLPSPPWLKRPGG